MFFPCQASTLVFYADAQRQCIPPTPPPTHIPSLMFQYPPVRTVAIHRFGC